MMETSSRSTQKVRGAVLPRGASDAALAPITSAADFFVMERLGASASLDAVRIARAIEFTRFPVPPERDHAEIDAEAGLVRAADLIGQLGDPHYLRKANALFHELRRSASRRGSAIVRRLTWLSATRTSSGRTSTISLQPSAT